MSKLLSASYCAGFFDGEGCVSLIYCKRRPWKSDPTKATNTFRLAVLVCNTDKSIIDIFVKQFGGSPYISNARKGTDHKTVYVWRAGGKENALSFLRFILPFCRVKKSQVKIAIKYLSTVPHAGCHISEKDWRKRSECYMDLAAINKRGKGQGHKTPIPLSPSKAWNPSFR